jgi:hypothetical protein
LITPIVGPIIAWAMNPWDQQNPWSISQDPSNTSAVGLPTITLNESVVLPKPYKTVVAAGF